MSSMESSSPRPRRNTIDAGQQSLDFQHYPVCPRGEVYDSVGVDSDGTEAGQGVRSSDAPVPFPRHRSPLTKQRTIQADVESPVTVDRSSVQVRGSTATTRRQAPQPPPAVPATHQSDRSDSGISQGVQSSPKSSSHSDSIPSWRSNSNGSSSGRPDGKGTANVPSEQLADTTTSVLVDNGSDISDCEVEPSTGVVFRKVTLRRKKRKDVEGVKRDEAEDEEDEAEEEEEDDNEEDVDPPIVLSEDGKKKVLCFIRSN